MIATIFLLLAVSLANFGMSCDSDGQCGFGYYCCRVCGFCKSASDGWDGMSGNQGDQGHNPWMNGGRRLEAPTCELQLQQEMRRLESVMKTFDGNLRVGAEDRVGGEEGEDSTSNRRRLMSFPMPMNGMPMMPMGPMNGQNGMNFNNQKTWNDAFGNKSKHGSTTGRNTGFNNNFGHSFSGNGFTGSTTGHNGGHNNFESFNNADGSSGWKSSSGTSSSSSSRWSSVGRRLAEAEEMLAPTE